MKGLEQTCISGPGGRPDWYDLRRNGACHDSCPSDSDRADQPPLAERAHPLPLATRPDVRALRLDRGRASRLREHRAGRSHEAPEIRLGKEDERPRRDEAEAEAQGGRRRDLETGQETPRRRGGARTPREGV